MIVKQPKEARWRDLVALLREKCPTALPLRVRVRARVLIDGEEHAGAQWTARDRKDRPVRLEIAVAEASWAVMKDTLLHEWAHALSDPLGTARRKHGIRWGCAMSRVYSAAVEP